MPVRFTWSASENRSTLAGPDRESNLIFLIISNVINRAASAGEIKDRENVLNCGTKSLAPLRLSSLARFWMRCCVDMRGETGG